MRVLAWPAFRRPPWVPYWRLLYRQVQRRGIEVADFSPPQAALRTWDIVHLHIVDGVWNDTRAWRAVAKAEAVLRLLDLARYRGARVVWTVHNLRSHEGHHPRLEERYWRRLLPRLHGVIHMTASGRSEAEERFPGLRAIPGFVIPQGHYRGVYPPAPPRAEARRDLGLPADSPTVLFIGRIRSYKNVPTLVRAFGMLPDPALRLVVAGMAESDALQQELETAADGDQRVVLQLGFFADDEIPRYMASADLVALPFREILNSASAMVALSYDRPVLVPAKGAMNDLQALVGEEWVRTYEGDLTPDVLTSALAWAQDSTRLGQAPLDELDWSRIADATIEAYRSIRAVRSL